MSSEVEKVKQFQVMNKVQSDCAGKWSSSVRNTMEIKWSLMRILKSLRMMAGLVVQEKTRSHMPVSSVNKKHTGGR